MTKKGTKVTLFWLKLYLKKPFKIFKISRFLFIIDVLLYSFKYALLQVKISFQDFQDFYLLPMFYYTLLRVYYYCKEIYILSYTLSVSTESKIDLYEIYLYNLIAILMVMKLCNSLMRNVEKTLKSPLD